MHRRERAPRRSTATKAKRHKKLTMSGSENCSPPALRLVGRPRRKHEIRQNEAEEKESREHHIVKRREDVYSARTVMRWYLTSLVRSFSRDHPYRKSKILRFSRCPFSEQNMKGIKDELGRRDASSPKSDPASWNIMWKKPDKGPGAVLSHVL